jgi:hypothetical protein
MLELFSYILFVYIHDYPHCVLFYLKEVLVDLMHMRTSNPVYETMYMLSILYFILSFWCCVQQEKFYALQNLAVFFIKNNKMH